MNNDGQQIHNVESNSNPDPITLDTAELASINPGKRHRGMDKVGLEPPMDNQTLTTGSEALVGQGREPLVPVLHSIFVGVMIEVPSTWSKSRKALVPPQQWWQDPRYEALALDHVRGSKVISAGDHNHACVEAKNYGEFAWLVSGIRNVALYVLDKSIRELVCISWSSCWVPLSHLQNNKDKHFLASLDTAKQRHKSKGPRGKGYMESEASVSLLKFMASLTLNPEQRFYAHKVVAYAEIEMGRSMYEVVKADFSHSYEHVSALGRNNWLFKACQERRIEAASALLKKLPPGNKRTLLQAFHDSCDAWIKDSKQ